MAAQTIQVTQQVTISQRQPLIYLTQREVDTSLRDGVQQIQFHKAVQETKHLPHLGPHKTHLTGQHYKADQQ